MEARYDRFRSKEVQKPNGVCAKIHIPGYGEIRQLILTGNGREEPVFFLTNDDASTSDVILSYSKRWRVENSIEDAVSFFNLNALSSPILIKIHFDTLLTMIADTLYFHLAQHVRGVESCNAARIFRHFVDTPAKIKTKGDEILVYYPLRAHSPVLRSAGLEKWAPIISWLANKKLRFSWRSAVPTLRAACRARPCRDRCWAVRGRRKTARS